MKKFISIIIIYLFAINAFSQSSNCNSFDFLDNCAQELGDFTFIKSYNVKLESAKPSSGNKTEFQYIFSKGHTYIIVVCGGSDKEMILNLLDKDKKKVSSNYSKETKQYYQKFQYNCNSTGVYYLEASFKGYNNGCGVVILGFKKPQ
ncbi:MAG: hypothetical protein A2X12_10730 [Bacteroidetes bacterium GWE2_29_8]|nr:MAG: hypothetical protein A2X12_10730 [Bacteroidetes bacterium GWE2_29_8]OFY24833.1 MAG: hypothetical protein A2X02_03795 [Bacteroidetes bacterium GWF2_29_10]